MTKQKQSSDTDTDTDAQRTSRRGVTTVITLTLVVGVVLAASISPLGVVAAATEFSVTTTAPETVSPDETIDITYTIENTGDTDLESLALSGTPQTSDTELTITDAASDSAATITDDNRIIFETVEPAASVTATLTVAVGTDATGTESLTANTTNGFGENEVSKQTVTELIVTTENTPPTANDVSVSTSEDTSVTEPFDASDPDGDPLSYSVESSPDHGTVSTSGNSFTYTPDSDYSGSDSFTYEVSDGNGGTDTATVSISVKDETENDEYEPNDRFDTAASITEGTYSSLQIVDVENDFFAVTLEDSDSINSSVIFDDSIGDLDMILYGPDNQIMNFSVSPSAGELVSAAEANEDGTYYIRIYGRDPGASPSYDLDVDISGGDGNDPPIANDMSVSISEDTSVTETFDASDPDGDSLSYSVVLSPDHGTVSTSGDSFTYTPDSDYSGSDSFTYEVSDGNGGQDTDTVAIGVEPQDNETTQTTVTVKLDSAPAGLQRFNVSVAGPSGSSITTVSAGVISGGSFEIFSGGEGDSTVTARGVDLAERVGQSSDPVRLYEAEFEFPDTLERSDLTVTVTDLTTDNGTAISENLLTVTTSAAPESQTENPVIGDNQAPATDPDGDGQLEDVTGDGEATFDDAIALAFNTGAASVTENRDSFDFDGDGDVDFDDAISLAFAV